MIFRRCSGGCLSRLAVKPALCRGERVYIFARCSHALRRVVVERSSKSDGAELFVFPNDDGRDVRKIDGGVIKLCPSQRR